MARPSDVLASLGRAKMILEGAGAWREATWFIVAIMVGAVALHLLGSINVVGVELISFAVGGVWFMLFVKNVEMLVRRTGEVPAQPAS